jgi:pyruvate/2-oxoglutarate dehydrogenase complex dihydrolipoamide acyltransferase (E2) component
MVGRALLIRAAWEISKGWGIAVLCLPLAPAFFRWTYKELAHEGQSWRTAATAFGILFFAITGSSGSLDELWTIVPERFRPASLAVTSEPTVQAANASDEAATAQPLGRKGAFLRKQAAETTAVAATPVVAATPAVVPEVVQLTPVIRPLAERMVANQREFARLGEMYEQLKKDRGYLRKGDQEAVATFNTEAAKYQYALAAARTEQMELNKQFVAKK